MRPELHGASVRGAARSRWHIHAAAARMPNDVEFFYARAVDREWMHARLTEFSDAAGEYTRIEDAYINGDKAGFDRAQQDGRAVNLRRQEPTVREILSVLDERLLDNVYQLEFRLRGGAVKLRDAAQRGLGILDDMDEWEERLAPDGPTLSADGFHPWVWDAARTFWASQHNRAAVDAAARAINAHTQAKVGRRDIFDTYLMNQVFTDKPKSGQSYLRLPGDPNDRTVQNRNRALRPFAEGCYSGIRALAAHEHGPDWTEQRALEALAALSILAHWIDECEVRTGP
jgi:hypothetical protein